MTNKVANTISEYKMIACNDKIVVGFSGGADSMSLLHVLWSLKSSLGCDIVAAHMNHSIRGEEALRDQLFCKNYCEKNHIPFETVTVDIPKISALNGKSTEEAAREERYKFLSSVAGPDGKIATAHTLSDNAETVIYNLVRGTALKGLCGIPPVRDNIIRPLINCTREDTENYCKNNNLEYVIDSTNDDVTYTRNKIRKQVIPLLKEINSNFYGHISNTVNIINSENKYLDNACMKYVIKSKINECDSYNIEVLKQADDCILNRCIAAILYEQGTTPEFRHVQRVKKLMDDGKAIILPNDVRAEKDEKQELLVFIHDWSSKKQQIQRLLLKQKEKNNEYVIAKLNNTVNFLSKSVTLLKEDELLFDKSAKINNLLLKNWLDYDKIKGTLIIRTKREGDVLDRIGRNGTKTLKKLFNEEKVPIEKRNQLMVIADDKGPVFVEGFGADKRVKIDNTTTNKYYVKILEEKHG